MKRLLLALALLFPLQAAAQSIGTGNGSANSGGAGNATFGTPTGNTAGDIVTLSNTTTGLQDSGISAPALCTFTPADASGASLIYTSVHTVCYQIGKLVVINFTLTVPTTISTASIQVAGLPATPNSGISNPTLGYVGYNSSPGTAGYTFLYAGANSFYIVLGGAVQSNETFTTGIIRGTLEYITN